MGKTDDFGKQAAGCWFSSQPRQVAVGVVVRLSHVGLVMHLVYKELAKTGKLAASWLFILQAESEVVGRTHKAGRSCDNVHAGHEQGIFGGGCFFNILHILRQAGLSTHVAAEMFWGLAGVVRGEPCLNDFVRQGKCGN